MLGTLTLAPPVLELQLMTAPPPPPHLNTDEDLGRNAAPQPHSPDFWENVLPAGRRSKTILRLHLMNFTNDVPGADISGRAPPLFLLDAVAQTCCTQDLKWHFKLELIRFNRL